MCRVMEPGSNKGDFIMEKVTLISRILLGLMLTIFGLNGFLQFIPFPPPPLELGSFMGALGATGYFFPLLKTTEILIGIALLVGRFVPLGLVVLAPITINIIAVHAFLDPSGLPMGVLIVILQGILVKATWPAYEGLLKAQHDKN
jgi:uncharacterized membrane protein YphA (DoxX/SURF4 family)